MDKAEPYCTLSQILIWLNDCGSRIDFQDMLPLNHILFWRGYLSLLIFLALFLS